MPHRPLSRWRCPCEITIAINPCRGSDLITDSSELYVQLPVHLEDGFERHAELIAHRGNPNRFFIALLGNDSTVIQLSSGDQPEVSASRELNGLGHAELSKRELAELSN